jgi:hypothetical protein
MNHRQGAVIYSALALRKLTYEEKMDFFSPLFYSFVYNTSSNKTI